MESNLESDYSTLASCAVSNLIGLDPYWELLAQLPDEYYDLPKDEQEKYWSRVYQAVTHNEQDVTKLAQLYQPAIISVEPRSV